MRGSKPLPSVLHDPKPETRAPPTPSFSITPTSVGRVDRVSGVRALRRISIGHVSEVVDALRKFQSAGADKSSRRNSQTATHVAIRVRNAKLSDRLKVGTRHLRHDMNYADLRLSDWVHSVAKGPQIARTPGGSLPTDAPDFVMPPMPLSARRELEAAREKIHRRRPSMLDGYATDNSERRTGLGRAQATTTCGRLPMEWLRRLPPLPSRRVRSFGATAASTGRSTPHPQEPGWATPAGTPGSTTAL